MADTGIKLDLSLHLENLLPGAVFVGVICSKVNPAHLKQVNLDFTTFFGITVFLASSYLFGVFSITISRLVVDSLSRLTLRWMFLWLFERTRLREYTDCKLAPGKILQIYVDTLSNALEKGTSEVKTEIARRRERARLLRSFLVPVMLAVYLWQEAFPLLYAMCAAITVLILYSYSEVMVFQEASLTKRVDSE